MMINTDNLVSITEANQNFSRVARMVDENGAAVILKNNVPRYILMEFSQLEKEQQSKSRSISSGIESVKPQLLKYNRCPV